METGNSAAALNHCVNLGGPPVSFNTLMGGACANKITSKTQVTCRAESAFQLP